VSRFSTVGVVSVAVVAGAGVVLTLSEVRSWSGLVSTGYGWTLLAKVALVALVVAIGGYNNRALVPVIRRTPSTSGGGDTSSGDGTSGEAWRRLHRTVRVEAVVLLVAVLAVTSALVVLPPTGGQDSPAQAAPRGPYDAVHPLGPEHQVRLTVDPALTGENQLTVSVLDAAGDPAELGSEVELRFHLPEAEIDRITRSAEPTGEPSMFQHTGPELSIAGTWEIEVRVQVDDFQRLTATAEVPIGAGDPGHHHHHD
jgi:copper transport protein